MSLAPFGMNTAWLTRSRLGSRSNALFYQRRSQFSTTGCTTEKKKIKRKIDFNNTSQACLGSRSSALFYQRRSQFSTTGCTTEKKKVKRKIDFNKYNRRQIALRIAYFGEKYHGFAYQDPQVVTVESCFIDTLRQTNLIEEVINYSRCSRTDKGVSGFAQVLSLQVRSQLLEGEGVIIPEGSSAHTRVISTTKELPYMAILNSTLPPDIRVLGWATVGPDFSARFNCCEKTYKYFFPRGFLNLEKMRSAAKLFVGDHNFRNFCKVDPMKKVRYVRSVERFDIETIDESISSLHPMCVATVTGKGFLTYQVRYMMAVLFLIGQELEEESVISHMLDVQRCPRKPAYLKAPAEPLILFDSHYEGLEWKYDCKKAAANLVNLFHNMLNQQIIRSHMMEAIFNGMGSSHLPCNYLSLTDCVKPQKGPYVPLRERPCLAPLETDVPELKELLGKKMLKP